MGSLLSALVGSAVGSISHLGYPISGAGPGVHPAELGLIMVLLAEHWLPGAIGVGVMEGGTMAWEVSGVCH